MASSDPRDPGYEPILDPSAERNVVFPIRYNDLWEHYQRQVANFWTPHEIDFSKDREHFETRLNDDERKFLKHTLAFFAPADGVVFHANDNFCNIVKVTEAKTLYAFQAMMENIHGWTYSEQIERVIPDPEERESLLERMGDIATVREKIEWAERWGYLDETLSFPQRLIGIAIVEGVFFQGAFCSIYWIKAMKSKGQYDGSTLPGLVKSNEFIARDEAFHCETACMLYAKIRNRLPEAEVHGMFREAVGIETRFISEAIPVSLIGMDADDMVQYIESVADNVLKKLGYAPLFGSINPFLFMQTIGIEGRSNFFEERVSLYQRATQGDNAKEGASYYEDVEEEEVFCV